MNWIKPMLLMVVLGGILYGVYTVLNKGPANEPTNAGGHEWSKPPDIQIGVVEDGKGGPPPMPANPDGPRWCLRRRASRGFRDSGVSVHRTMAGQCDIATVPRR